MASMPHHIIDDAADAIGLANGTTVTADFDDINTGKRGEVQVKDGYSKMDWDNFLAISPTTAANFKKYDGSGYDTGITSGKQDAYNGDGTGCSIHLLSGTFTMASVEMTAVFDKTMVVEIYSFDSHFHVSHDIKVTINDATPTLIKLNWTGVTEVDWQVKGEKEDPVWAKKGDAETDIAFDDFKFSDIDGKSGAPVQFGQHPLSYGGAHGFPGAAHVTALPDLHASIHPIA